MLAVFVSIVAIIACRCDPNMEATCIAWASTQTEAAECTVYVYNQCPQITEITPETDAADRACKDNAIAEFYANGGYDEPTPTPAYAPQSFFQSSAPNCSVFRLTSPLDGLPNGTVTFYWDAQPAATSYQIVLRDEVGATRATFSAPGTATNLTADVSQSAIGGQFLLSVEAQALGLKNNVLCTDTHTIFREAGAASAPMSTAVPATPAPVCGNNICEAGERTTCRRDCA